MTRGKDLIGHSVIQIETGKRLGEVREILFDPDGVRVLGLVLSPGGWFDGGKAVPFDSVRSFGPDAVVVEDEPIEVKSLPGCESGVGQQRDLVGKRLLSEQGRDLGTLDDVIFDAGTGGVMAYQVSGGFIQDLMDGRDTIFTSGLSVGRDAVIVDGVEGLDLGLTIED